MATIMCTRVLRSLLPQKCERWLCLVHVHVAGRHTKDHVRTNILARNCLPVSGNFQSTKTQPFHTCVYTRARCAPYMLQHIYVNIHVATCIYITYIYNVVYIQHRRLSHMCHACQPNSKAGKKISQSHSPSPAESALHCLA